MEREKEEREGNLWPAAKRLLWRHVVCAGHVLHMIYAGWLSNYELICAGPHRVSAGSPPRGFFSSFPFLALVSRLCFQLNIQYNSSASWLRSQVGALFPGWCPVESVV